MKNRDIKDIKAFKNAISQDLHLTKERLYTKYAFMAGFCGLTMKEAAVIIYALKSKQRVKNV